MACRQASIFLDNDNKNGKERSGEKKEEEFSSPICNTLQSLSKVGFSLLMGGERGGKLL